MFFYVEASMIRLSKRSDVDPFFAMDVLEQAQKRTTSGQSVIFTTVGQL